MCVGFALVVSQSFDVDQRCPMTQTPTGRSPVRPREPLTPFVGIGFGCIIMVAVDTEMGQLVLFLSL